MSALTRDQCSVTSPCDENEMSEVCTSPCSIDSTVSTCSMLCLSISMSPYIDPERSMTKMWCVTSGSTVCFGSA